MAREVEHPDGEAVERFVEQVAIELFDMGVPRMPARVFACVLAADDGALTAGELAKRLRVSPAAISGAVRYLVQVNLVVRRRDPGARIDRYAVRGDDIWSEMYLQRLNGMQRFEDVMGEGAKLLGPDTPAGRRIHDTQRFFEYIRLEMPKFLEDWRVYRDRP